MRKFAFALAVTGLALAFTAQTVRAHSAQQCLKELQTYAAGCKFSPTAFLLGFCKNKKAQKWCSDKKLHDDKFHK